MTILGDSPIPVPAQVHAEFAPSTLNPYLMPKAVMDRYPHYQTVIRAESNISIKF
jgi:hypothetical protein